MKTEDPFRLAHNPELLGKKWQQIARRCGASFEAVLEQDALPVFCFRSRNFVPGVEGAIYLSAGIHGDEPASVLGLLSWAEKNLATLKNRPVLMFPCLNPWGLRENSRRCARGGDLNRVWNQSRHPLVRCVEKNLAGVRFSSALTLHEDYDASGIYLYEPSRQVRSPAGEEILRRLAKAGCIVDSRRKIEGIRPTVPGLIRRKKISGNILSSLPEALFLFFHPAFSTARVFTFETASETDLHLRIQAQELFVEAALEFPTGEN